jgi:hypothetical protein
VSDIFFKCARETDGLARAVPGNASYSLSLAQPGGIFALLVSDFRLDAPYRRVQR